MQEYFSDFTHILFTKDSILWHQKSVSWARVGRNFRESQLKCFKPAIVNPEYQNVDGLKTHGMLRPHCWTFRLSLIWALVTEKERREGQGL